ncbi:MAG TPA: RNA polymerase sigma factor [Candidatus Kapabacteria bacterium]|jgi:RNA polymerase sigma-70 factor (ECF subfamily)|nr:RNA polymerase sigma factor [Candidatus Kapabacteria bacterium]
MTNARQREFLNMLEPVYDRLSRYALAVTRDEMDGEDLVSATVLAAYEAFDKMVDEGRFLHYLIKIASRLHKRHRYRERRRVAYSESFAAELPDTNSSPEIAAEIRLVMDAMNMLPEKMRETVVLFEVSDFSLEEIRRIQGGTLSAVKTRLKRGRERLAKALGVPAQEVKSKSRAVKPGQDISFILLVEERYV